MDSLSAGYQNNSEWNFLLQKVLSEPTKNQEKFSTKKGLSIEE